MTNDLIVCLKPIQSVRFHSIKPNEVQYSILFQFQNSISFSSPTLFYTPKLPKPPSLPLFPQTILKPYCLVEGLLACPKVPNLSLMKFLLLGKSLSLPFYGEEEEEEGAIMQEGDREGH